MGRVLGGGATKVSPSVKPGGTRVRLQSRWYPFVTGRNFGVPFVLFGCNLGVNGHDSKTRVYNQWV